MTLIWLLEVAGISTTSPPTPCGESQGSDLPLGGKRFSGGGHAHNKSVAIEELLSDGNDEIFANDFLAVADTASVPDRRKIPERDIPLETRKGVVLSYALAQVAI